MYKINASRDYSAAIGTAVIAIGPLFIAIFLVYTWWISPSPELEVPWFQGVALIPLLGFVVAPILLFIEARKKSKRFKRLEQKGHLYKDQKYTLEYVDVDENPEEVSQDSEMKNFVVRLALNGAELKLIGRQVSGREELTKDTVDVLIDPDDPKNYFIDFNIEPVANQASPAVDVNNDGTPPPIA